MTFKKHKNPAPTPERRGWSISEPRVALTIALVMAVSAWSLSYMALSSVYEYSEASTLKRMKVNTISDTINLQLDQKEGTEGVYLPDKEYESRVMHNNHVFNAVGVKLDESIPVATSIDVFIRAGTKNKWSDWTEIERDEDGFFSEQTKTFSKLIPTSTSKDIQYKVKLHTDNTALSPLLTSVEIVCINSDGWWSSVLTPLRTANLFPQASAAGNSIDVISRGAWGADESLRVLNDSRPDPQFAKIAQDVIEQYINENSIIKTVKTNEKGERLTWPEEYTATVDKIVIHHTGKQAPTTQRDALAYLRAVYYYHAISRGWGDIGYNYVIDPFGNIYEGRAGGDRVVGAHAGLYNRGTIGVALMGEFSSEEVSPAQVRALIQLLKSLTTKYGIDPQGISMFRGKELPNIIGHRDVGDTNCPGDALYGMLPGIRRDVASSKPIDMSVVLSTPAFIKEADTPVEPINTPVKPKQVTVPVLTPKTFNEKDFEAAAAYGNPQSVSMTASTTKEMTMRFINKGTVTWNKRTYLESTLKYPGLTVGDEDGRSQMEEQSVKPGETATFKFSIASHLDTSRRYALLFDVFVNGFQKATGSESRVTLDIAKDAVNEVVHASSHANRANQSFGASESQKNTVVSQDISARRVKISFEAPEMVVVGTGPLDVYADGAKVAALEANEFLRVKREGTHTTLVVDRDTYAVQDAVRVVPLGSTILEISNFSRALPWDPIVNDNQFRGILEIRPNDTTAANESGAHEVSSGNADALIAINELPVEDYLKGVGEVSELSTHVEKKKAMAVVARSYALFYMTRAEKFPGAPYHLDDSASTSQKYLGYGFEKRSPNWVAAVDATHGQVVTYQGQLVKTPYFSQSDGRTRSAEEVWGWTDTPYLVSVPDPLCGNKTQLGHGVGLSGCGAEMAAERGYSYTKILSYYYHDTALATKY